MVTETELLESTLHQALWMAMKKEKSQTINYILILTLICLNVNCVTEKWQICYSSQ
jgi:hypothetical protein